jgi:hypothetical protein
MNQKCPSQHSHNLFWLIAAFLAGAAFMGVALYLPGKGLKSEAAYPDPRTVSSPGVTITPANGGTFSSQLVLTATATNGQPMRGMLFNVGNAAYPIIIYKSVACYGLTCTYTIPTVTGAALPIGRGTWQPGTYNLSVLVLRNGAQNYYWNGTLQKTE